MWKVGIKELWGDELTKRVRKSFFYSLIYGKIHDDMNISLSLDKNPMCIFLSCCVSYLSNRMEVSYVTGGVTFINLYE